MISGLRVSASHRSAFLNEARVLTRLHHPNICQAHDFFEDRDWDVLVLELIDGQTLRAVLESGKSEDALDLAGLDGALVGLERLDARQAEIVTLRFSVD